MISSLRSRSAALCWAAAQLASAVSAAPSFFVWHITDVHVDPWYTVGSDAKSCYCETTAKCQVTGAHCGMSGSAAPTSALRWGNSEGNCVRSPLFASAPPPLPALTQLGGTAAGDAARALRERGPVHGRNQTHAARLLHGGLRRGGSVVAVPRRRRGHGAAPDPGHHRLGLGHAQGRPAKGKGVWQLGQPRLSAGADSSFRFRRSGVAEAGARAGDV